MKFRQLLITLLVGFGYSSFCPGFCQQDNRELPKTRSSSARSNSGPTELGDISIQFRFDIQDMVTNHQFVGQRNTFHVSYDYSGNYKGGGFDPLGHRVSADTFPYFQTVRNGMIDFIQNYPDRDNFYELFGSDICKNILSVFPQIRQIELTIEIPAFAQVDTNRSVKIVMSRPHKVPASRKHLNESLRQ